MTIANVKYTDLDHTQLRITLDDGRDMFAGVEGATWLHADLNEWINGGGVIEPLPQTSLSDTKTAKLHRINAAKNTYLDGGFLHNGVLFDSDIKARAAYLELAYKFGTRSHVRQRRDGRHQPACGSRWTQRYSLHFSQTMKRTLTGASHGKRQGNGSGGGSECGRGGGGERGDVNHPRRG